MLLQVLAANQRDTKWQCDPHHPPHHNGCSGLCQSQGNTEMWTLETLCPGMPAWCWCDDWATSRYIQGRAHSAWPPASTRAELKLFLFTALLWLLEFLEFTKHSSWVLLMEEVTLKQWIETLETKEGKGGNSEKQIWCQMTSKQSCAPLIFLILGWSPRCQVVSPVSHSRLVSKVCSICKKGVITMFLSWLSREPVELVKGTHRSILQIIKFSGNISKLFPHPKGRCLIH